MMSPYWHGVSQPQMWHPTTVSNWFRAKRSNNTLCGYLYADQHDGLDCHDCKGVSRGVLDDDIETYGERTNHEGSVQDRPPPAPHETVRVSDRRVASVTAPAQAAS